MGKSFSATNERFKNIKKKLCKKFHKRVINHIFLFLLEHFLLLRFLCCYYFIHIFFSFFLHLGLFGRLLPGKCIWLQSTYTYWSNRIDLFLIYIFITLHIYYTFIFIMKEKKEKAYNKKKIREKINFYINLVMIDTFYRNLIHKKNSFHHYVCSKQKKSIA